MMWVQLAVWGVLGLGTIWALGVEFRGWGKSLRLVVGRWLLARKRAAARMRMAATAEAQARWMGGEKSLGSMPGEISASLGDSLLAMTDTAEPIAGATTAGAGPVGSGSAAATAVDGQAGNTDGHGRARTALEEKTRVDVVDRVDLEKDAVDRAQIDGNFEALAARLYEQRLRAWMTGEAARKMYAAPEEEKTGLQGGLVVRRSAHGVRGYLRLSGDWEVHEKFMSFTGPQGRPVVFSLN